MQWELCKVWSQSSLILPKALDQTEGLIAWKSVANTKDQTFHLCIFFWQRLCFHVMTFLWRTLPFSIRVGREAPDARQFRPADVTRGGQLLSRSWCSHSNQFTQTCTSYSHFNLIMKQLIWNSTATRTSTEWINRQPNLQLGQKFKLSYLTLMKDPWARCWLQIECATLQLTLTADLLAVENDQKEFL